MGSLAETWACSGSLKRTRRKGSPLLGWFGFRSTLKNLEHFKHSPLPIRRSRACQDPKKYAPQGQNKAIVRRLYIYSKKNTTHMEARKAITEEFRSRFPGGKFADPALSLLSPEATAAHQGSAASCRGSAAPHSGLGTLVGPLWVLKQGSLYT